MIYRVVRTVLKQKKDPGLYEYLDHHMHLSNNLYNATLFRIRQNFTSRKKEHPTENELEVQREIEETLELCPHLKRPKSVLGYKFLERMMRVMDNPDFFAGLPSQTAEECQKAAVHDFRSWLASLREYKKHPEKYLEKPKMPHYKKKRSISTITFSNQGCKIKEGNILRFALTNETIHLPYQPEGRLKEVKVKPYYGDLLLVCTFECPDPEEKVKGSGACAIDLGVENIAAIVSSKGDCWLYKGGVLKEKNQWYNKQLAKLRSIAMKGHDSKEAAKMGLLNTKQMRRLHQKRDLFFHDAMHKISSRIVQECMSHGITTIVIGVNERWKQSVELGKNTQSFVQMPFYQLRKMIEYKAERVRIEVISQEESYTSKADLTAGDHIPTYGVDDEKAKFSGTRVKRGLYQNKEGNLFNADLIGAGNILRKKFPETFSKITDFSFLQNIKVIQVFS